MAEIIFHPDTAHEIKRSYEWYQNQAEGLGDDFIAELESAYEAIAELPRTWPKFTKNCRRFLLSKFPFSVVYQVNNDSILYWPSCITAESLVIGKVAHNKALQHGQTSALSGLCDHFAPLHYHTNQATLRPVG